MKLTDIVKNPELKNAGIGKYRYSIKFKGDRKPIEVDGHMGAVHTIVDGLLNKKMMTVKQLHEIRACASYHLLVEVTDLKSDDEIKQTLVKAGWKNRYSLKHKIHENNRIHVVCREWVTKRVDKLIAGVSDFCTVTRIQTPEDENEVIE